MQNTTMNTETTQIGLTQLATLIFSTAILISQPKFALAVLFFMGLTLAVSVGCCAAIGFICYRHYPVISLRHYGTLLGTHLGGTVCYSVTFIYAMAYVV